MQAHGKFRANLQFPFKISKAVLSKKNQESVLVF